MKKTTHLFAALALGASLVLGGTTAFAAGKQHVAEDIDFSFEGIFGTFDRAQLQRGFLVYKEVCSACHAMKQMSYRNLSQPGGPELSEDQAKAIAAEIEVTDGPNAEGEMFERPAVLADSFKSPFPNENAARSANGGAYPVDLSLITKKREGFHYPWYVSPFIKLVTGNGGPEYVHAVLTGYSEPEGEAAKDAPEDKHYNPYFAAGPWISMAPPLSDDAVEYADGTKASVDQMATDVAAFLTWASEPKMEERKSLGFKVILYLALLSLLLYLTKKRIWGREPH
jgi:ubiquinol-cytochrome c reductase cytochrome b/c1 subunit